MPDHASNTSPCLIRSILAGQLFAVFAVAIAVLFRAIIVAKFDDLPPYVTFFPVVLLTALLGDVWAGIAATILSALAADYWAIPPKGHFAIGHTSDAIGLAIFAICGVTTSVITELYHRNRQKLASVKIEQVIEAERRKAAEAQKVFDATTAERRRLFEVLDTLPTMVSLLNEDHHIVFANRSFRKTFGEDNGRPCYEACFGHTTPCRFCESFSVLESGRPHHWEHPGPSGEVIEAFDYPFTDTDGSHLILKMDVDITGRRRAETELNKYRQHLEALVMERTSELRVANAQLEADIAERQQTEQALLNSNVRLNLALEVAELGEWELDTARNSTQRSLRHAQIFGYTSLESEWNMEKFMNHVLPEHRDGVGATLQSARAHGGIHDFETQIRRADGEVRWIWVRNCTHLAASGQVERIFGVILDTTERKAAEEVLRSKEARLRLALGAAKSGTWELDLRTGEAEWSDELWALYGLDPFSCVPSYEAWLSTVHLEDSERVQQEIKDAARNGTELDIDYRVPGTSGEIRWLAVRGQPILNEKMELVSYIGIVMDITERKLTEAALLSSEKLASVGRMAASIAHEINNPLAAVTNSMFLARLNAGSPDSVRKFLDMADDELKRVAHITRQTLGFYRETVSPISISVGSIMDSAIDVLRGKIKKIHPRIEKQYKGDLQVLAIPGELRQVFANLLLNSLDAIVQGGAITLRISPSQGTDSHNPHVRVTVADSGPGIDPATLPHIFEPLFTTKASTGTGLGLWVVSQILEKHGGTIRVRSSRREGASGTVFSILLPANANLDPNANA